VVPYVHRKRSMLRGVQQGSFSGLEPIRSHMQQSSMSETCFLSGVVHPAVEATKAPLHRPFATLIPSSSVPINPDHELSLVHFLSFVICHQHCRELRGDHPPRRLQGMFPSQYLSALGCFCSVRNFLHIFNPLN
jgi:hypothetical protein